MKFLCNHCKAKYQISDDRVAGRTLRMKCRKCGHDIIIRGAFAPSSHPAPAKDNAKTAVPTPITKSASGSLLGKSFEKSVTSSSALAPEDLPLSEQWHAALDNKPQGPFSVDQIKAFFDQGKLTAESLVWRDGFSDWTALSKVPELRSWSAERLSSWPPIASSSSIAQSKSRAGSSSAKLPGGSSAPRSTFEVAAQAERSESQNEDLANIGFDSTVIDDSGLSLNLNIGEPTSDPEVAPPLGIAIPSEAVGEPTATAKIGHQENIDTETNRPSITELAKEFASKSAASIRPGIEAVSKGVHALRTGDKMGGKGLPLAALAVLVASAAFGVTLALVVASHWLNGNDGKAQAAEQTEANLPSKPSIKLAEVEPVDLAEPEVEVAPAEEESTEKKSDKKKNRSSSSSSGSSKAKSSSTDSKLNSKDQQLLDKYSQSEGSGPTGIKTSSSTKTTAKPLSSVQVRAVVSKNRSSLQRCYELAARSSGNNNTVRIDVRLTVSPTGSVSKATVNGPTVGNLKNCIMSSVRRWRFPISSESTEVPFPLVFQPGA
ncbi:MAG: zinc-ribbon domain-containing protein [Myxococcales bacterium]|nr:MAG: zinc-ribbon domain-containing protein [Myxococcales bacterium]